MFGIFTAIRRFLIWVGVVAEDMTNTDGINQAVVERGIRDSKEKASKASEDNGKLAGSISLLKEQLKKEGRQKEELRGLLSYAASINDEVNGANYAEQMANLEETIKDNQEQFDALEAMYKQNTQIIAESIRQIQKFQTEFNQLKIKASMSRSMDGLATMMKSSITELQGMVGGEMSDSMEKLTVRCQRRRTDQGNLGSRQRNGFQCQEPAGSQKSQRSNAVQGIPEENRRRQGANRVAPSNRFAPERENQGITHEPRTPRFVADCKHRANCPCCCRRLGEQHLLRSQTLY